MTEFAHLPSAALAESERIRTARRLFFEEGTLPSGLVPDAVLRGVGYRTGEAVSFDPVQPSVVSSLCERSHDLIEAARPEFERLARVLGEGAYGLLLTDADGHAVAVHGPLQHCGELIRRALRPGVNLAEARIGTSAMSTAMAEGQAIGVFGQEHFFAQHGSFQCAAAPIYGVQGELRGTIDVTRDTPLPQFGVLSLMQDSASVIEATLLRAVPARLRVRMCWYHGALGGLGNAMMAFGADGEVVAANVPCHGQCARSMPDCRY
ncbi:GAF domain-containing protein [Herbaspirillum huttiense]|uniref:GAF domain-containing protein n=1 Tax=Herbaspirillum huttiense TaxID=863372 RepID=UPI000409F051|nr:GAF domain-containing protein [Herbaspirillum huttiense]